MREDGVGCADAEDREKLVCPYAARESSDSMLIAGLRVEAAVVCGRMQFVGHAQVRN
jgi:hypothetical protein